MYTSANLKGSQRLHPEARHYKAREAFELCKILFLQKTSNDGLVMHLGFIELAKHNPQEKHKTHQNVSDQHQQ